MNLAKIKEIAKSQGKPLGGVAEAAGLTSPGLDYIIKENNTKVDVLQRIARYLGVSIMEFIEDDTPQAQPVGNMANVGNKFHGNLNVGSDQNISRALDILEGQLKAKDEQIGGLIKALNR